MFCLYQIRISNRSKDKYLQGFSYKRVICHFAVLLSSNGTTVVSIRFFWYHRTNIFLNRLLQPQKLSTYKNVHFIKAFFVISIIRIILLLR